LVFLYFFGLIAIVRSQEAGFPASGIEKGQTNGNRSGFMNGKTGADAYLMALAERELGAFIGAVTEVFGPEQARIAAEDWVDELESMDALPGPATRDWGSVTVAASARLARRLSAAID
jgi:hypothetical protein